MIKQILTAIALSFTFLLVAACGGGGGDSAKTSVTFKVNLSGNPGGNAIEGAEFTVTMPSNVTPATTGGAVVSTVVTPSGIFAGTSLSPSVTYTPAGGAPGALRVLISSSAPAGASTVGEIATITLQLANGVQPVAADFPVNLITVIGGSTGGHITGLSASVSGVTLQ